MTIAGSLKQEEWVLNETFFFSSSSSWLLFLPPFYKAFWYSESLILLFYCEKQVLLVHNNAVIVVFAGDSVTRCHYLSPPCPKTRQKMSPRAVCPPFALSPGKSSLSSRTGSRRRIWLPRKRRSGGLETSRYVFYAHTVRNLHFLSENSTLISRENCRFFGEKN